MPRPAASESLHAFSVILQIEDYFGSVIGTTARTCQAVAARSRAEELDPVVAMKINRNYDRK